MADEKSLLERPYAERQLIVVVSDEVVEASNEAERKVLEQQGIDWPRIGDIAASLLLGRAGELALEATKEIIKAWSRVRASGIDVIQVGVSESASIDFAPGHPRNGVLYIGHPAMPSVYYSTAEFHRVTFEHKVSEAVNLLMHLGATKIRVEHVMGWSRDFSSRLTIPLGQSGESGSAEAGAKASAATQILYEATLSGTTEPRIPENLVWYPHEPTWQTIAQGRVEFGLQDFSLGITYEDDFGVHAGLKATVLKAGLEIGGSFEDHRSTVWRLDGSFAT